MKYMSMKVVVDYDPINLKFISFIPSKILDIKGTGDDLEDSINNLLNSISLLHKSIKEGDKKVISTLENWISNLSVIGKVKISFTKTFHNNIKSIMIGKVRGELVKQFY